MRWFIEDVLTAFGSRKMQRPFPARMYGVPVSRVTSVKRWARKLYLDLHNNPGTSV